MAASLPHGEAVPARSATRADLARKREPSWQDAEAGAVQRDTGMGCAAATFRSFCGSKVPCRNLGKMHGSWHGPHTGRKHADAVETRHCCHGPEVVGCPFPSVRKPPG